MRSAQLSAHRSLQHAELRNLKQWVLICDIITLRTCYYLLYCICNIFSYYMRLSQLHKPVKFCCDARFHFHFWKLKMYRININFWSHSISRGINVYLVCHSACVYPSGLSLNPGFFPYFTSPDVNWSACVMWASSPSFLPQNVSSGQHLLPESSWALRTKVCTCGIRRQRQVMQRKGKYFFLNEDERARRKLELDWK